MVPVSSVGRSPKNQVPKKGQKIRELTETNTEYAKLSFDERLEAEVDEAFGVINDGE